MPQRQLVTGAAGLIGFELTRTLIERGDQVLAVDDLRKGGGEDLEELAQVSGGRLELVFADLASPITRSRLSEESFGLVLHFAAVVGVGLVEADPYGTIEGNLRSTLAVFDAARSAGAGVVVFASSSECYASGVDAGQVPLPTPEGVALGVSDPRLPRWSYAASKIAGESALFAAAQSGAFTPLVLRFHNVYGPRMRATHVIPELLERCRSKLDPFPLLGADQTRSFLHVQDAARAILLAAEAEARGVQNEIVHVGSGIETRIEDLAEQIFELSAHHPRVERRPAPKGSVHRRVPDVSRLAKLGFEPSIGLEQGLRSCWEVRPEPVARSR